MAALIAGLDASEEHLLGDEMRSVVLDHGTRTARVTVLLHGLTASPRTWREFARVRHARGENVLIPRLPRHGHADRMSEALVGLTHRRAGRRTARVSSTRPPSWAKRSCWSDTRWARRSRCTSRTATRASFAPSPSRRSWGSNASRATGTPGCARCWRRPQPFLVLEPDRQGARRPRARLPPLRRARWRPASSWPRRCGATREGPPQARHIEIVRNASETSVNNRAMDDLVARWRAVGGDNVRLHRLIGLGAPRTTSSNPSGGRHRRRVSCRCCTRSTTRRPARGSA